MTAPIRRPSEWGTLGDHERRIRILEASPGGDGTGGVVYCVGCYEVSPEFAECVNLFPTLEIPIDEHTVLQGTLNPSGFTESETEVGPYLCNWLAGFRLQVRYAGIADGFQTHLYGGVSHTLNTNPSLWTQMPTPVLSYFTPVSIDTGWVTIDYDPTGVGANSDPWYVWFGADNDSILFNATVGDGIFYFRWVHSSELVNMVPQPQTEGQILVASGSPLAWVALDPGTPGQVLTISGGGVPEWA